MTIDDLKARVQAGAKLLDEREPGWAARINLKHFRMAWPCGCVLGQLHGDYSVGLTELFGPDDDESWATYAFSVSHANADEEWEDLDAAWTAEIQARR